MISKLSKKISGSVPANNYIQFPADAKKSMGLVGHYVYIAFKANLQFKILL